MAELRIPIISEFKGQNAFNKANKATSTLEKSTAKLGKALLAAFSVQKITQFGKAAAKAFIEDEKAASRLAIAVKNVGLAFETPRIEEFISQLSRASGVTDNQLRPSMQKLLTTTGSVAKSTELLKQALDISAGSGVDFETVVNDLSMAYVGQTRGLRKYSLGLTQAELKTMSFADIQEKLNSQFSGANAQYLTTYAGKMGILSNAAGEAQENIGKGLVEALSLLAGDGNTIQPLADSMLEFSTQISNAITGIAVLINKIKAIPGIDFLVRNLGTTTDLLPNTGMLKKAWEALTGLGKGATPGMGGYPSSALGPGYIDPNDAKRRKSEADAAKRNKELAALQKKSLDTQKKQNALTKAAKTLDLDRIGITAALRNNISETDRISLQLQLALLDKNESQALKLSAELTEATKRQNDLKAALLTTPEAPNPYRNWIPPVFNVPTGGMGSTMAGDYLGLGAIGAGGTANSIINVQVVVDGDVVGGAVTSVQQNQSLSGTFSDVSRYNGRGAPSVK
ncbi:hypothetical protein UFOVP790_16 [uncultured Caudovirales phage]|uniref:Uncharacterized protein n=1 Tax=uncultured Caudovirales phage TaxID=2100421 RepID=A0A6J5NSI6_9CAUD|nr:hypothetical protein UFOVP790_16 [uncultured Caudovirales phage]